MKSVYGSSVCPNCKKKHHAVLAITEHLVPPPSIIVACQCNVPVTEVVLFYNGAATNDYRTKEREVELGRP